MSSNNIDKMTPEEFDSSGYFELEYRKSLRHPYKCLIKVEGLRGIATIPAKLESTTLVFAYGVDLFFTRLAPSRTYDSLTEDFSYALLLLTIVALLVGRFLCYVGYGRKERAFTEKNRENRTELDYATILS
ncbi:UNVERIFIED_CONTAM: ER membrane protein complex subunit [Sesamum calycinum]|uniref:ER membrane protein complex subunit 1 n=1 Tax=Sesamum calycinum TaxID=2727403 RepID=A0AAW2J4L1_9LAMI